MEVREELSRLNSNQFEDDSLDILKEANDSKEHENC